MSPETIMLELRDRGLFPVIAKAAGTTRQAVRQWKKVPPHRVLLVEKLSGYPRYVLRPDIYPPPRRRNTSGKAAA